MTKNMKTRVPIKMQSVEPKKQPAAIRRRINAGWLRLWRAVYPDTPPPGQAQSPKSEVQNPRSRRSASGVPHSNERRPAAVEYLGTLLGAGLSLAVLVTGCSSPRPLKGGQATTTHKPAGIVEQTLVQGENASQATRQNQETVKVRTYTIPAGSRIEASQPPATAPSQAAFSDHQLSTLNYQPTFNSQPSPVFTLSSPMPVVEREESHARTELGAAQKDMARELGAKLSGLKGIVWLGALLFVAGLVSLVWPPAKAIVGSVTTSAALMLGALALMVLPSLIAGNELLILGGVAVAVGGWFLAHRHGHLRGMLTTNTGAQPTPPRARRS